MRFQSVCVKRSIIVKKFNMLVTLKKLLTDANSKGYAIGAFNVTNLESIQAVIRAAEETKSAVIIQTTEKAIQYAGIEYLRALCITAAVNAKVKVAFHLDHGKDLTLIKKCIDSGWTSVMFDGSALSYKENCAKTKKVVSWAKKQGVSVEAELGAIKGKEDYVDIKDREVFFTNPKQAIDFVKQTGIDALAISVGTAHGPFKFFDEAHLDFKRIAAIKKLTKKPLVLHGASGVPHEIVDELHNHCNDLGDCARLSGSKGVPDSAIRKAVQCGINKINIDSDLRIACLDGIRTSLLEKKEEYDPRVFLSAGREKMKEVVKQKIALFSNRKT